MINLRRQAVWISLPGTLPRRVGLPDGPFMEGATTTLAA
jgi:hypothetical protein